MVIIGFMVIIGIFFIQQCCSISNNFILDYFIQVKPVEHVVVFSCDNTELNLFNLTKTFHQNNLYTTIVKSDNTHEIIANILNYKIYAKCGVVVDCECLECMNILLEASYYRYFNQSYSWLILLVNNTNTTNDNIITRTGEMLNPILNIGMNADVTVAAQKQRNDSTQIHLINVYSKGRHLGQPLILEIYGVWCNNNGMQIIITYPSRYDLRYRGNMTGILLRGVVAIDRPNVWPEQIDELLTPTEIAYGISNLAKYHYALNIILRSMYKFNIKYRITRGWAGRLPSNFRIGLFGVVARGEADIVASGAFKRMNRHDEFDYIHEGYNFEAGFIFRLTPEISATGQDGNFFAPFSKYVWYLIIIFGMINCVTVYVLGNSNRRHLNYSPVSLMLTFIHTIGAFCQQGIEPIPSFYSVRFAILTLILGSFIIYNYYTSSVVGGLLSSVPIGPKTINDILESQLILSFEDIGYHKILFRETNSTVIKKLYNKKVLGARPANSPPVFTSIETVLPYLQKGGYAFHSEMNSVYPALTKKFDANEICELREVTGLFTEPKSLFMIQPKRNQYSEMFKIGLLRANEIGLIHRTKKLYQPKKPICQSGALVHPVSINGVIVGFKFLGFAYMLSLFILIGEILIKRYHLMLAPKFRAKNNNFWFINFKPTNKKKFQKH